MKIQLTHTLSALYNNYKFNIKQLNMHVSISPLPHKAVYESKWRLLGRSLIPEHVWTPLGRTITGCSADHRSQ